MEEDVLLPVRPTEPMDDECCGTGCTPCVFDIYKRQVKKWEEECQRILIKKVEISEVGVEETKKTETQLTPEEYRTFNLTAIVSDTHDTNIYRFNQHVYNACDNNDSPFVEIGQHIVIRINTCAKQYTVLNVEDHRSSGSSRKANRYFDVLIKIYPNSNGLTSLIRKLKVNDKVEIRGPFGKYFQLKVNEYENLVILAAGTGIAPMYRIIENILNNEDENTKITLMFCNRSPSDLLLKSKLTEWSSFWNFKAIHYLSKNDNSALPYGFNVHFTKFSQSDFVQECEKLKHNNCYFLVCGTRSFEKDVVNFLTKLGIPETKYHVF